MICSIASPAAPDSPAVPAKGPSAVVTDTSFVMNVVPLTTDMIRCAQIFFHLLLYNCIGLSNF